MRKVVYALVFFLLVFASPAGALADRAASWADEWPRTDFSKTSVVLKEIDSSVARDSIPSIDAPRFALIAEVLIEDGKNRRFPALRGRYRRSISENTFSLSLKDPVISVEIDGDARAYPLRIMMYHEIVNDIVGGRPVAVTYCPLCNTAIVFDRSINGEAVEFGTTGKLRHSDLVMYDRRTHSWWQQYTGKAIVGEMTGYRLERLVARLESYETFMHRFPNGRVLVGATGSRAPYGRNPYFQYDTARRPFLYRGGTPSGIKPLARVVVVNNTAYALSLVQEKLLIEEDGYQISWTEGQASALDSHNIADGRDVGNVVVQKLSDDGAWRDVSYDVTFAFTFHAFQPDGRWRF